MYEELIKSLRWLTFMFPETHPAKDDADRMSNNIHLYCQLAADAIEVLSKTEKTTRWIPVTEDLPVIDPEHHCSKDVIVRTEGGGYMFSALEENIFGQAWFECERMSPSGDDGYTVTHWMPFLPLPEDVE